MSGIPPFSSFAAQDSSTSLISDEITSSLGSVVYRVKWADGHNFAWLTENWTAFSSREKTQILFDKLVETKEIISNPNPIPSQPRNVLTPDFDFGKPTLQDHKRYLVAQLNAQMDLAQSFCLDSPFFSLLRKRLLISHRILYSLHCKFHEWAQEWSRSSDKKFITHVENPMSISFPRNNPTEALIEMGVRTSLNLVFNLLKMNGMQDKDTGPSTLCLEVLDTAKTIIFGIPPMSLKESQDNKLHPLGIRSLDEITKFLKEIVALSSATQEVRDTSAEIILGLALQRFNLQYFLEWIEMALRISDPLSINLTTFTVTLCSIHQEDNSQVNRVQLLCNELRGKFEDSRIPMRIVALVLSDELVKVFTEIESKAEVVHLTDSESRSWSPGNNFHNFNGFWTDFSPGSLRILKNFISRYCPNDFTPSSNSPFHSEEENVSFILRCFDLIKLSKDQLTERGMSEDVTELRELCFKMLLEINIPSEILRSIAEILRVDVFLPPLSNLLQRFLGLIKEIHTLSFGQRLFCDIMFDVLLHHQKVCELIGLIEPGCCTSSSDLLLTEELLTSILSTLTEHALAMLDEDFKEEDDCPDKVFSQRMQELVALFQNHIFAELVHSPPTEALNISILLKNHLTQFFESVCRILKKAEDSVIKKSERKRILTVLYNTIAGTLLNNIIHSMLLPMPIHLNFFGHLDLLQCVFQGLSNIVSGLSIGSVNVNEDFLDSDLTWFIDMQKCCGFLVGKLIGELIRGSAFSREEFMTNNWLSNWLFSHGLELTEIGIENNIHDIISKIATILLQRKSSWEQDLIQILMSYVSKEHVHLLSLCLPSTTDGPHAIFVEHAASLDWQNFDAQDDIYIDSCSRLVLLVLMNYTTDIAFTNNWFDESMSMSRKRQDPRLHDVFTLAYQIRSRLILLKQEEILLSASMDQPEQLSLGEIKVCTVRPSVYERNKSSSLSLAIIESVEPNIVQPAASSDVTREDSQSSSTQAVHYHPLSRGPACAGLNSSSEEMAQHIQENIAFAASLNVNQTSRNISIHSAASSLVDPNLSQPSAAASVGQYKAELASDTAKGSQNGATQQSIKCESSSYTYTELAKRIVEKSLLLLLFVKSPKGSKEVSPNDDALKAQDAFKVKESELVEIRKLGRNVLRFLAYSLLLPKQHLKTDAVGSNSNTTEEDEEVEGWITNTSNIINALRQQENRAGERIMAFEKANTLIGFDSQNTRNLAFTEYFIAGCFQLGIFSPMELSGNPGIRCPVSPNIIISNMEYLSRITAARIDSQVKVAEAFRKILQTLITALRAQVLHPLSSSNSSTCLLTAYEENGTVAQSTENDVPDRNESTTVRTFEFLPLSLFIMSSYEMMSTDIKFVVENDLLAVLEKLCRTRNSLSDVHKVNVTDCVYVASTRLLHIIAVSATLHADETDPETMKKISEVLYEQLTMDLSLLCGSNFYSDSFPSDTPRASPDSFGTESFDITKNQVLPQHPMPWGNERMEMESQVATFLALLRRITAEHSVGKFFCTARWIKLILSFLSIKPSTESFSHLFEDEDYHHSALKPPFDLLSSRDVTFLPDLKIRLKALNLLESILHHLSDSFDLKEYVIQKLMALLSSACWNVPLFDRAKSNLLSREELCRNSSTDEFKFDVSKTHSCVIDGQTLLHGRSGRGYSLTSFGFSSGVHAWKFLIVKDNRNEGICLGVSRWPIRDWSADDMYLFKSNGTLIHKGGELPFTVGSFTQGDFITCILDMDNRKLSFGKNGEGHVVAFQGISQGMWFPCVLFCSVNPGEKVKITDYEQRSVDLLSPGDPFCAPAQVVLAEGYVSLIRNLHSSGEIWNKVVNDSIIQRLSAGKYTFEELDPTTLEPEFQADVNSSTYVKIARNNFDVIERLCNEVWPVLAVMGGIDRGLMVSRKCLHKLSGKTPVILGALRDGIRSVKIQHDDYSMEDMNISYLEPITGRQFNFSKFICITADILQFLTKLTGMSREIRFPSQDDSALDSASSDVTNPSVNDTQTQQQGNYNDIEALTSISAAEGSQTLYVKSTSTYQRVSSTISAASETCVDKISNTIVTNIISEVTRKGSQDYINTKDTSCHANLVDKMRTDLEWENIILKISFIRFGAMKTLATFFSCPHFVELILAQKTQDFTKAEKKREGITTDKDENVCSTCSKTIPTQNDNCPNCVEIATLQNALCETFQQLVSFSIGPLQLQNLIRISDLERIQSVIHQIHVKQLVDSIIAPKTQSAPGEPNANSTREAVLEDASGIQDLASSSRNGLSGFTNPVSRVTIDETEPIGMQIVSLTRSSISADNSTSGPDNQALLTRAASSAVALRRRLRRSPSPPQLSPIMRQRGPVRIPNVLLEMGFSSSHVLAAMNALNVATSEPPVNVISSLASWMLEHPESAEDRGSHVGRPWSLLNTMTRSTRGEQITQVAGAEQTYSTLFANRETPADQSSNNGPGCRSMSHLDNVDRLVQPGLPFTLNPEQCNQGFQIPIISVPIRDGEQGLCYFCKVLRFSIVEHFLTDHEGCNQLLNSARCGEIQDNIYWLCFNCYIKYGASGWRYERENRACSSSQAQENVSWSLALPPLTGCDAGSSDESVQNTLSECKLQCRCEDEFVPFLPYLSLSRSKPYPSYIPLKESDMLGAEAVEKVTETNLKVPYENSRYLVEQVMLIDNKERIQTLEKTTEAGTMLLARSVVVKVLTLLSTSDAEDLAVILTKLGLSDVSKLIKLMHLVAGDRIGGIEDEEMRFYNSTGSRSVLLHSGLSNDARICTTLTHITRAVEAIISCEDNAVQLVIDLCVKALVKASVGFDSDEKTKFSVILCLVGLLSSNPRLLTSTRPQSPSEPSEDLPFINALSMCVLSSRLSVAHRAYCTEQLVNFITKRKKVLRPSESFSDFGGVLKCQVVEIAEHESRVSSMVWSKQKKVLCTSGGNTVRTYSMTARKALENDRVLVVNMNTGNANIIGNELHGEAISSVACSGLILVAGISKSVNLWLMDGSGRSYKEEFRASITKLKFPEFSMGSPENGNEKGNCHYLLIGFHDGSVGMLSVCPNALPTTREILPPDSKCGGVVFLDWVKQDAFFAVGYSSGLIKITRQNHPKVFCQRAHLGKLTCMEFASEEVLLTCGDDRFMRVWVDMNNENVENYSANYWFCAEEIELDHEPVSLACSKRSYKSIALGLSDGAVSIWRINSHSPSKDKENICQLVHQLRCCPFYYPITNLVFNDSGTVLACGTSKGLVTFWSVQFGTLLFAHTSGSDGGVQQICSVEEGFACCYNRSNCVNVFFYDDQQIPSDIVFSMCRKSLIDQGLGLNNSFCFKNLLKCLPSMIYEQYAYEKLKVENGDHLLYSRYLQALAKFALILRLDKVLCEQISQLDDPCAWEWLGNLNMVIKTAKALARRSQLPSCFVEKFQIAESCDVSWTLQMDYDVMSWANASPSDWYLGGKSTAYMFGAARHGQLGFPRASNLPKLSSTFQNVCKVVCGQNCTFTIHIDGSVSAIGEGSYGRLGLGNSDDMTMLTVVSALQGYMITQVVTSLLGDGHCLAVSVDGECFSWADGDLGKLGHGNTDRQRRPKQIEFLRQEKIVQVAVGAKHSCCLTYNGEVYVFGSCETGRLGLGICSGNKKLPEKLTTLSGIGYIACGSSHTICISRDGNRLWAFGDNENGKLGINSTTIAAVPTLLESFQDMEIASVVCGSQFSVFLTKSGQLYTCGQDKLCAQSSGRSCTLKPTQVAALRDKVVVDVAAGAEHTLCVTSESEVFAWGSNGEGQLGLGHSLFQREPVEIKALSGKGIQQVEAGKTHSSAWTAPRIGKGQNMFSVLGTPPHVPQQYARIQDIETDKTRSRLKMLRDFSDLLSETWRFLHISPVGVTSNSEDPFFAPTESKLRPLYSTKLYLPFIKTIFRTNSQQRSYGPTITVRRIASKGKKKKPIFTQISKQVVKLNSAELRLPARSWKVRMVGEAADDAGGVFDDTITEMCVELTNGSLPFLIPTPNNVNEVGCNRDKFLLNPERVSSEDLEAFKFIGILFGVAIRTKKPVALNLAPIILKSLVGEDTTTNDLEEVDCMYISCLHSVRDNTASNFNEENFHEVIPIECFEGTSATGKIVPIVIGGRSIPLTFHNRFEYVERAIHFRLHEMDLQIAAVREGMSGIIPVPLLSLMTGTHLEQLVCGSPSISVSLLKQIVRYREVDENHELVRWFWAILEEFTNAERVLFMRFVSGRSRLPANIADFTQRFQLMKVDRPLDSLPTSQTCFFQLRLPPYSSKEMMAEKLRYAINNCTSIDMDNYMLVRNGVDEDDDVEIILGN